MPATTRPDSMIIACRDKTDATIYHADCCPLWRLAAHPVAPLDSIELFADYGDDAEAITCARCGGRILEG